MNVLTIPLLLLISTHFATASASCIYGAQQEDEICNVSRIALYASQKTMTAGDSELRLVAEVLTKNGMSPANETLVTFIVRMGGESKRFIAPTEDGIAFIQLPASTISGAVFARAHVERVSSEEQQIEILPSTPAPFELTLGQCDARKMCEISVRNLQDVFGNSLLNGTIGTVRVETADQVSHLESVQVVHGSIRVKVFIPEVRSKVSLSISGETGYLFVPGAL
ncbi:MAG: hypothetical protein R3B94_04740 [Hyphomonas sp.]